LRNRVNPACFVLAAACLAITPVSAEAMTITGPGIVAWTQMVVDAHTAPDPEPAGHLVVHAITTEKTCPAVMADGAPLTMEIREAPSANFPVTMCQATPPAGAHLITVGGTVLPAEPVRLRRIIVIGDTGCRLKGPLTQDCNDVRRWPFPLVAAHAAE